MECNDSFMSCLTPDTTSLVKHDKPTTHLEKTGHKDPLVSAFHNRQLVLESGK